MPGGRSADADPWMVRPPQPLTRAEPTPGLRITCVESDAEMLVFERTVCLASGGRAASRTGEFAPGRIPAHVGAGG